MLTIIKLEKSDIKNISTVGDNVMISPKGNDSDVTIMFSKDAAFELLLALNRFRVTVVEDDDL